MIRRHNHNQRPPADGRNRGFTLVELMLVISIIGLLAGISITATRQVYHTARVAKTEATILKIDRVLMDMYAGYENRRVPSPNFGSGNDVQSQVTQAARLWFLRDMIRMEMPCNKAEIEAGPVQFRFKYGPATADVTANWARVDDSPLRQLYFDAIQNSNGDYESAKCLYLVVMYGNPEVRELFFDHEIATDDDGLSYFVDGWGNPIYFLRWAPGLTTSERQPRVLTSKQNESFWIKDLSELSDVPNEFEDDVREAYQNKEHAATNRPEPLDPTEVGGEMKSLNYVSNEWQCVVDLTQNWSNGLPKTGWTLLPVVLSSSGVWESTQEETFGIRFTPTNAAAPIVDPFDEPIGAPLKKNDNPYKGNILNHAVIHNHSARR